jgi:hypothetical protein
VVPKGLKLYPGKDETRELIVEGFSKLAVGHSRAVNEGSNKGDIFGLESANRRNISIVFDGGIVIGIISNL